jgi:RNA polymerase sigma factor (sigma-70 family)
MHDATDMVLLRQYAGGNSDDAFAALVSRHVNLVYSAALRKAGNPHAAEEITQAVFIILAQKAGRIPTQTILPGWLYQTARLTAANYLKREIRRVHREQEAFMQSQSDLPRQNETVADETWQQLAPLLEDAMGQLGDKERAAVLLRFFGGRSFAEVAATASISENAAKKRVSRATERLRKFFLKRGVASTAETIAGAISAHSVQAAPVALAKTVTAVVLAKGATASISTLTLVKSTLFAMKTKVIIATVATTIIVAGITTWLAGFHFSQPPKKAAPDFAVAGVQFPIQLPNAASRRDAKDPLFEIGLDPDTRRTSNSAPAIHIKGPLPPPPDLPANFSDAALQKAGESSSAAFEITNGSPLLGQHVRITGWLKCSQVQNWAAAYFCIYDVKNNRFMRFDSMDDRDDRPILKGTMDWQQVEFVTDIPDEPCFFYVGPDLYGPGELWGDDFQIALASADTPITDDRRWRHTSAEPNTYSQATDFQTKHDGHPTVCLAYAGTGAAPAGSWEWWGQKIRGADVDKYAGHTIEWTGWIKSENVSNRLQPTIRPFSFNPLNGKASIGAKDRLAGNSNLKGTQDWTQFSVTCAIPDDINHIDTAFILYGGGKVWIDMASLKFKIIK